MALIYPASRRKGNDRMMMNLSADTRRSGSSSHAIIVAAALFFGDVRHTGNQTYNTASGAARDGVSYFLIPTTKAETAVLLSSGGG